MQKAKKSIVSLVLKALYTVNYWGFCRLLKYTIWKNSLHVPTQSTEIQGNTWPFSHGVIYAAYELFVHINVFLILPVHTFTRVNNRHFRAKATLLKN